MRVKVLCNKVLSVRVKVLSVRVKELCNKMKGKEMAGLRYWLRPRATKRQEWRLCSAVFINDFVEQ